MSPHRAGLFLLSALLLHLLIPSPLHADGPNPGVSVWKRLLYRVAAQYQEPLAFAATLLAIERPRPSPKEERASIFVPLQAVRENQTPYPQLAAAAGGAEQPTLFSALVATAELPSTQSAGPASGPLVWRWPTASRVISDPFGVPRGRGFHTGIDIVDTWKAPVYAIAPGGVVFAGDEGATYGLSVIIRHPNGWMSRYAHLSGVYPRRGEWVEGGQLIGQMGDSGYAFGTHLHLEIIANGRYLDPLAVLQGRY